MHENYNLEELLQLVEEKQFRRLRTLLDNMNWVDIAWTRRSPWGSSKAG